MSASLEVRESIRDRLELGLIASATIVKKIGITNGFVVLSGVWFG